LHQIYNALKVNPIYTTKTTNPTVPTASANQDTSLLPPSKKRSLKKVTEHGSNIAERRLYNTPTCVGRFNLIIVLIDN
jgi:hypothetical protein